MILGFNLERREYVFNIMLGLRTEGNKIQIELQLIRHVCT